MHAYPESRLDGAGLRPRTAAYDMLHGDGFCTLCDEACFGVREDAECLDTLVTTDSASRGDVKVNCGTLCEMVADIAAG